MLPKPTTALRSNFTEFLDLHCLPNGLFVVLKKKNIEKTIKMMQEDVYFGDQHSGGRV